MKRLLWIDPADVPAHMKWPWGTFWLLTVVAILCALFAILGIPDLLRLSWYDHFVSPDALRGHFISIAALSLILLPKFFSQLGFLKVIPRRLLIVVIALGVLDSFGWNGHVTNLMILGALIYLAETMLLPYFGDAASYLSAQTETVQSRQGVRNRGLALLKALHEDKNYDRVIVIA